MKTWTFVTAVFWLFYHLCVCPLSDEQTTEDGRRIGRPTTIVDTALAKWYFPNCVRPPPLGRPDPQT